MGLKAQRFALSGFAGFGVTDRVVPNVETEAIKPCGAFNRVERMPEPRLTGLQGSPHLLEPPGCNVLRVHDGVVVSVENDQVIRVPNDSGSPEATAFGGGEGGGHCRLPPVQGPRHQEGGKDSPLRGTGFRWKECFPIHDARFEPGRHGPAQRRKGVEFRDKCLVTDAVEALFDGGVQDLLVLLVHAGIDGGNGIVTRAAWTEAGAVGLELRLPFRLQGKFRHGVTGAI